MGRIFFSLNVHWKKNVVKLILYYKKKLWSPFPFLSKNTHLWMSPSRLRIDPVWSCSWKRSNLASRRRDCRWVPLPLYTCLSLSPSLFISLLSLSPSLSPLVFLKQSLSLSLSLSLFLSSPFSTTVGLLIKSPVYPVFFPIVYCLFISIGCLHLQIPNLFLSYFFLVFV